MILKCFGECNKEKDSEFFSKDNGSTRGYQRLCKDCKKIQYKKNKEEILAKQKIYRTQNNEKLKKRQKIYYGKNREILLQKNRECQNKNKAKYSAQKKEYRIKNKDEIKRRKKIYYKKNKDEIKKKSREWEKNNPEKAKKLKHEWYLQNKHKFIQYKDRPEEWKDEKAKRDRQYRLENWDKVYKQRKIKQLHLNEDEKEKYNLYFRTYYEENIKGSEKIKKYRKSRIEIDREYKRKWAEEERAVLADSYMDNLLVKHLEIKISDLPEGGDREELRKRKRALVKFNRTFKQITKKRKEIEK